jgi:hypothetical protein
MSNLETATSLPADFKFDEVRVSPRTTGTAPPPAPLGPLAAFVGNWHGSGFNTIFRPDNPISRSSEELPHPLPPLDNLLELNLTLESLSFQEPLGRVPNRGEVQGDIFLNGVPYLQTVQDITTGTAVGIHLEPGLWIAVPETQHPAEEATVARMASIPHGTTICAQGTYKTLPGAPTIPHVDITPFTAGNEGARIRFPSQEVANELTQRIPQDLTQLNSEGKITQEILNDPNEVLRKVIAGQRILSTVEITIKTKPVEPLFGGGADNIAFLLGYPGALTNPDPPGQNAQSLELTATFWIEEVQHTILVPPFVPGEPPLKLTPENAVPGIHTPTFTVRPPGPIEEPRTITFTTPQIQYSQLVLLNFNRLSWPHVSVSTLTPSGTVTVPSTVWGQ